MGTWRDVIQEIQTAPNQFDTVRTRYLADLANYRGRNVIAYYSSFLHKNEFDSSINDLDMQSFMAAVHGLDRSRGLDLLLHTPGGGIAATEAIVTYLRDMFRDHEKNGELALNTVEFLSSRHTHFAHERHIGIEEARDSGLHVVALEEDQELQELVVTLHHAYTHTLQQTSAVKIVENHDGVRVVNNIR